MCTREPLLWQLLSLVDAIPEPPPPSKRRRGCPVTYPDTLFLKILLLMVLRRFFKVHEVYGFLSQESAEIDGLRALLFPDGKVPSRRTLERRMKSLPESLPERIALLGEHLVELYQPWQHSARAVAIDSTVLRARGAPWHMADRRAGRVPNTSIDTDAHWTHSSWHGWTYGYKLHLAVSMSTVWIPLAAEFKPANEADNTVAEELVFGVLPYVKFFCGDSAYNCPNVREAAELRGANSRGQQPGEGAENRSWRGGPKDHPRVAAPHYRELQRPLQEHLRCTPSAPDQRAREWEALRPWLRLRLPARPAAAPSTR